MESVYRGNSIGGSNPPLSATKPLKTVPFEYPRPVRGLCFYFPFGPELDIGAHSLGTNWAPTSLCPFAKTEFLPRQDTRREGGGHGGMARSQGERCCGPFLRSTGGFESSGWRFPPGVGKDRNPRLGLPIWSRSVEGGGQCGGTRTTFVPPRVLSLDISHANRELEGGIERTFFLPFDARGCDDWSRIQKGKRNPFG